ncbi:MAG: ABC transporter permease [Vicinamibacterales bacterium]
MTLTPKVLRSSIGRGGLVVSRRLAIIVLQVLGVVTIVFVLIHLLPGNPAFLMAGPNATEETVRAIEERLGLDKPLPQQYATYVSDVLRGDLGDAWSTGNPVLKDIGERLPATLVLITVSLLLASVLALLLAGLIANRPRGRIARAVSGFSFLAGALPDFWIALALIFVAYFKLGLVPAPAGQIDPQLEPQAYTHVAAIDSVIALDWGAFTNAAAHMVLPVLTLVIVYVGPILRVTLSSTTAAMGEEFIRFGRTLGLRDRTIAWYALKRALPTFVTAVGSTYGFLLGGTVLVETIFSWGGIGQYAVQAVTQSDYTALQGFVIVAGLFTALVWAAVDVLYWVVNPRSRAA